MGFDILLSSRESVVGTKGQNLNDSIYTTEIILSDIYTLQFDHTTFHHSSLPFWNCSASSSFPFSKISKTPGILPVQMYISPFSRPSIVFVVYSFNGIQNLDNFSVVP